MSRWNSYLNSASAILLSYKGEEPFASHLKKNFAANKKFGSKDRKQIAHLCYCFWRLGNAFRQWPLEERIVAGVFLCSNEPGELLLQFKPDWIAHIDLPVPDKFPLLQHAFEPREIFPWLDKLSEGIDQQKFAGSFFIQPGLFLRTRPGMEITVKKKLSAATIAFEEVATDCLALPNSSKVDSILALNREAVIQDYSSQRVKEFLIPQGQSAKVWDCCAASGGKSILAKDVLGDIQLTVSDVRESILINLKKRLAEAGIQHYHSFIADLSHPLPGRNAALFDLVIADVPCSGSGTWSRTPEQLSFYADSKTEYYAALQQKIVSNIVDCIKPGGHLLYITCSVFKQENEDRIDWLQEKFHLRLVKMELLKGYDRKADTMFAALLQRPL